jgi:hypothetical protein
MAKKRNLPKKPLVKATGLTFETLVLSIRAVDQELAAQASRAVNVDRRFRGASAGILDAERSGA